VAPGFEKKVNPLLWTPVLTPLKNPGAENPESEYLETLILPLNPVF